MDTVSVGRAGRGHANHLRYERAASSTFGGGASSGRVCIESRSRAVYWDGRNHLGETVASGLYFYTLTAGEFSATRRMLILK